ncbi:MAG: M48 family metallopeptidase [Rhodospirillaceae bacterium]
MSDFRVGSRVLPVTVRPHPRAKRMSLRVDPLQDRLLVVVPASLSGPRADALVGGFLRAQSEWISSRLKGLPDRIAFGDGSAVPFLDDVLTIAHQPEARRGVWRSGHRLCVSGPVEHLSRRVSDYLRQEARQVLAKESRRHAETLGVSIGKVTVRDTRSRWGSCSAKGNLSYSWRLILAPSEVVRYVSAHEVAHRREFNHSPAFWRLVDSLVGDAAPARAWLSAHGADLHRYG